MERTPSVARVCQHQLSFLFYETLGDMNQPEVISWEKNRLIKQKSKITV